MLGLEHMALPTIDLQFSLSEKLNRPWKEPVLFLQNTFLQGLRSVVFQDLQCLLEYDLAAVDICRDEMYRAA